MDHSLHGDGVVGEDPVHAAVDFPEQNITGCCKAGADTPAVLLVFFDLRRRHQQVMTADSPPAVLADPVVELFRQVISDGGKGLPGNAVDGGKGFGVQGHQMKVVYGSERGQDFLQRVVSAPDSRVIDVVGCFFDFDHQVHVAAEPFDYGFKGRDLRAACFQILEGNVCNIHGMSMETLKIRVVIDYRDMVVGPVHVALDSPHSGRLGFFKRGQCIFHGGAVVMLTTMGDQSALSELFFRRYSGRQVPVKKIRDFLKTFFNDGR